MAQIVKLRRSSTSGKIPTTANLELGELAMNTYDGRIFFEKNTDGTITIEEIVTTDTERPITGSLNINGAVTASYFVGDGSGLTNLSTAAANDGTITLIAGTNLSGGGSFTTNQASDGDITFNFNSNGTGIVSGSVLRPNGDDIVSGSVLRNLNGTNVVSGSVYYQQVVLLPQIR